jgi:hypothetical protein
LDIWLLFFFQPTAQLDIQRVFLSTVEYQILTAVMMTSTAGHQTRGDKASDWICMTMETSEIAMGHKEFRMEERKKQREDRDQKWQKL